MSNKFLTTAEQIESLSYLNSIDFFARQIVDGFISGIHKSPYHGFSVEFAEHRVYNQGESVRHIDWKLFGRTDKLFVKNYEAETNLRCQIVIDCSSSMFYPTDKTIHKAGYSALCAAAISHMLNRQRDAVGLTLFSDKVDEHFSPHLSNSHQKLIFSKLDDILRSKYNTETKTGTATADTLHQIAEVINKRSLVVLFTDMFTQTPVNKIYESLEHLRYNKNEVIIFHVTHKKTEQMFELDNRPYKLIDMETGESFKLNPAEYREYYLQQIKDKFDELKKRCLQYKIELVEADIDNPFSSVLSPWLVKRSKLF
ncbi:MAG: DUF58 domain-containing protein [Salinivirgaceae bacterium]|jgi:uncharacterized protein (DUF58 family)|nr:DUF58 domain-containing protein [Bacteroidales bacterium]